MKNKILSYIAKSIVIISATIGVILSYVNSNAFMGGKTVFLYFTIQSNIWIALFCLVELVFMASQKEQSKILNNLKLMFTVSISLTGFVFCFILAPTIPNAFALNNVLTHVVSPLFSIIDFFLIKKEKYTFKSNLFACIPPLYYLCFSSILYVLGVEFSKNENYPYFFLNWGSPAGAFGFSKSLPFMGVFYWILVLLLLILGLSLIFTTLNNRNKKSAKI